MWVIIGVSLQIELSNNFGDRRDIIPINKENAGIPRQNSITHIIFLASKSRVGQ